MMNVRLRTLLTFLSLAALMGSNPSRSQEHDMTQSISKAEIEAAATKRVVFAHQSVGRNILEGAGKLAAEQGVSLNIVQTRRPPAAGAGIFHFDVGRNGAPESKIADYAQTVGAADFPEADVALVKLCYVDMDAGTDPAALAKSYGEALDGLQKAHPGTRFVAMTSPLTQVQGGAKAWVKGMLGRSNGDRENAVRHRFNEQLRQKFGPDRLFDLAKIESASQGGGAPATPPALRADLTDDGGHLNDKGQRLAGAAFLKMIAASGK
jgi:hypothetical protein